MLNYETDIKDLEELLADDTAIAEHLSHITANPILIADVENFLDFNGLASRNPITGVWEGPLPTIVTTEGHPLAAGLAALFGHLNKPRSVHIDTTEIPWCGNAWTLLGGLVTAGAITAQQRDDFYALGGGLPHADTTAQDVAEARTAYQDQVAAEQALQRLTNVIAVFNENMTIDGDAAAVWTQALAAVPEA